MKSIKLFWLIVTEHWKVQVCMYFAMFLVVHLLLSVYAHKITTHDSLIASMAFALMIKSISVLSSLLKSAVIILMCKRGSSRFKSIYMEWTGTNY